MTFEREIYLRRLGLADSDGPTADAAGLARLQQAQMRSFTFENIDPLLGRVPDLDPDAVWRKLLLSGRGGYCFELNGLFAQALQEFGFAARPLLARVRMGAPTGGPRSHHAFIVSVEGREYLADTGFGGPGPLLPLSIENGREQNIDGVVFRIRVDQHTGEEVVERLGDDGWFSLYGFDRAPVAPPDYQAANFVAARWDRSQFPFNLTMTRMTESGRISLRNRMLRTVDGVSQDVREVASPEELSELMRGPFDITVDDEDLAAVWQKVAIL